MHRCEFHASEVGNEAYLEGVVSPEGRESALSEQARDRLAIQPIDNFQDNNVFVLTCLIKLWDNFDIYIVW